MKCSDLIRLAIKETALQKFKLLLGLLLWISLITVALCVYRFSFSFRDCLYQYLRKYNSSITAVDYVTEEPLEDLKKLEQIEIGSEEISLRVQNNYHLKFLTQENVEITLPVNNVVVTAITSSYDTTMLEGRALTAADDTEDGNAVVIGKSLAEAYDIHVGDAMTASMHGHKLRTMTVCGIGNEDDNIIWIPARPYLSIHENTGVYCPATVSLTVHNPAAYYDLKEYLDSKGIIIYSEFEKGLGIIEIASEVFWLISLLCMLLAMFSMINYCSIFIAERNSYIVLLKTLGMKEISVSLLFYSVIIGLFFIAYTISILLQKIVYLHFQAVFTSILKVTVESVDHFASFALLCFLINVIFVSIAFFGKIGKLIHGEDIAAVRLQDN